MRKRAYKNKFFRVSAAACIVCALVLSCSGQKRAAKTGYLCREHGLHNADDRGEFVSCFQIQSDEIDQYYLFSRETTAKTPADIDAAANRQKELIADEIVELIMGRLELAFGNDIASRWHLESIDLDVPFRRFVFNDSGSYKIKVFAVMRKDDLSPRSLIRFLPLEYKMNLMKPTDRETFDAGDPKRR